MIIIHFLQNSFLVLLVVVNMSVTSPYRIVSMGTTNDNEVPWFVSSYLHQYIYLNFLKLFYKDEDGRTDTDCEDDGGLLDDFWDLFTGKGALTVKLSGTYMIDFKT